MPRNNPDGIALARLDGTARRLLREKADRETCVAELHAISTDATILGTAAGTALGGWRCGSHDGDPVARMLTAAGADTDVRDEVAAATERRLRRDRGRSGIGNP